MTTAGTETLEKASHGSSNLPLFESPMRPILNCNRPMVKTGPRRSEFAHPLEMERKMREGIKEWLIFLDHSKFMVLYSRILSISMGTT